MSWGSVADASAYNLLEQAPGASTWSPVYQGTALTWSASGKADGSWGYRVYVCNSVTGCGAWGDRSYETVAYVPATPTGFTHTPLLVYTSSIYTLSWDAMAHAASYNLDMDGFGATQTGITGTSENETAPAQAGTDISWQVQACNGAGECSAWSSPALNVYVSCHPGSPGCTLNAPQPRAPAPHTAGGGGTGALVVTVGYNSAGYPVTLTRNSDGLVYGTIGAMDAWGHATSITEANGVTITRGYSQVTGLALNLQAAPSGSAPLAQYTYSFDGYGNLSARDDVLDGTTEAEHYDALNRLTKSVLSGAASGTTTFAYDPAGDITSRSDRGSYTYGGNSAGPHAVTAISDGSTFTYDADGEMVNDNGETLTWAAFGQATSIQASGTTVSLSYDADDSRYQKSVSASSGSETVLYLDASEKLTVNGQASIRRTLMLADLTIIDTGGANAGLLFPIGDHLGSTIVLDDGGGASAQAMSYGPFGRRMTAGWAGCMSVSQALTINETESDRGYTGQEELDAVSLVDDNARLYDPALGRFLSVDPLIAHPESTQGINPYSYVENNPLNKTDPTGEASGSPEDGPDELGCNPGSGGTSVCSTTPLGSHIPQSTTVSGGQNGSIPTTSGAGALPGGRIAANIDGTSFYTLSSNGSALQGQGITGQDPQKPNDHTEINGKAPTTPGGDSAAADAERVAYLTDHFEGTLWGDKGITETTKDGVTAISINVTVSGGNDAFNELNAAVKKYWNVSVGSGDKTINLQTTLTGC